MRTNQCFVGFVAAACALSKLQYVSAQEQEEGLSNTGAAVTTAIIAVLFVAFVMALGLYCRRRKDDAARGKNQTMNNGDTMRTKQSVFSYSWSTLRRSGTNGKRARDQQEQRQQQQKRNMRQQQSGTRLNQVTPPPPQVQMSRPSLIQRMVPQYVVDWWVANSTGAQKATPDVRNYPQKKSQNSPATPMRSPDSNTGYSTAPPRQKYKLGSHKKSRLRTSLSTNNKPKAPSKYMKPKQTQSNNETMSGFTPRRFKLPPRNQVPSIDPRNEYATSSTTPRNQLSDITSHSPDIHVASRGTYKRVASSMIPQIGILSAAPGQQQQSATKINKPNTSMMPQSGMASTQKQRVREYSAAPSLRPSSLSPSNITSYTSTSPGF